MYDGEGDGDEDGDYRCKTNDLSSYAILMGGRMRTEQKSQQKLPPLPPTLVRTSSFEWAQILGKCMLPMPGPYLTGKIVLVRGPDQDVKISRLQDFKISRFRDYCKTNDLSSCAILMGG